MTIPIDDVIRIMYRDHLTKDRVVANRYRMVA